MIYFQNSEYRIDLSSYKITFIETSDRFTDNMYKNYSLPINIAFDDIVLEKLGLPNIENITTYLSNDRGILYRDDRYFDAVLLLGNIVKNSIEVTLYYGDDTLPVYDINLKDLPWPVNVNLDFNAHAKSMINKGWPSVPHNWPSVFRREISGNGDYDAFIGLINNYDGSNFVENELVTVEGDNVAKNYNVMSPCTYLLEMVSFGYKTEGKKIKGAFFENEKLKKTLYIPEGFIESFKGTTYNPFSFSLPTSNYTANGVRYGEYNQVYVPTVAGSYKVSLKFNLPPALSSSFKLEVFQKDAVSEDSTSYYNSSSTGNRVVISEEVTINVDSLTIGDSINIRLTLKYDTQDISGYNSCEYSLGGGQLNTFPIGYSVAGYMPDMTFGEFINALKNWLNLDITIEDEWVTINFLPEMLNNILPYKHDHLEDPRHEKKSNKNKLYKLSYEEGALILVSDKGQIYSDVDQKNKEVVEIEMGVKDVIVEQNANLVTAAYPEKRPALLFCIYDGLQGNKNACVSKINGSSLSLQDIYDEFWKVWLGIRTNNFSFEDEFLAHITEPLGLNIISYKYNELHMIKQIKRTRKNNDWWEVEVESETM